MPLAPEASASKLSPAASVNDSTLDATARQVLQIGIDMFSNVEPESYHEREDFADRNRIA
jgi:hypothetical protein